MTNFYETPINRYYRNKDRKCIDTKAAFIYGFSVISRKLKIRCGVEMSDEITEESFESIKREFHNISKFSFAQTVSYFDLLSRLRNMNAHFFRSDAIYCDNRYDFIFNILDKNIEVPYKLIVDNYLTMYGMIIVMCLMLDITFINKFFQRLINGNIEARVYKEFDNTDNKAFVTHVKTCYMLTDNAFTSLVDHKTNSPDKINGVIYSYLNDCLSNNLNKLFYEFEYLLSNKYDYFKNKRPFSLKELLMKDIYLSMFEEEIKRLVLLRNIWLHGYWLYDVFEYEGAKYKLTIELIIDILKSWKTVLVNSKIEEYNKIISTIKDFGLALIRFKYGRLIEISYKISDLKLYKEEKIIERVKNSKNAFNLIISKSDLTNNHIDLALDLIGSKKQLYIHKDKFSDKKARFIDLNHINFLHFKSSHELKINGILVKTNEITLYEMPDSDYINNVSTINDKSIRDYKVSNTIKLNNLVDICEINID